MYMIINLIVLLLNLYTFVILARVLMSWLPNLDRSNPLVKLIYDLTEPVLRPVREMLPPMQGMDFSPMAVMIGVILLTRILTSIVF